MTPAFRYRLGVYCSPLLLVEQTRERLDKDVAGVRVEVVVEDRELPT